MRPSTAYGRHHRRDSVRSGRDQGAGEGAIEALWREREQAGHSAICSTCAGLGGFAQARRRVLEALVRSGAFDELGVNRATLMAQLPEALRLAEQHSATTPLARTICSGWPPPRNPTRPSHGAVLESADQPVQPGCATMPSAGCSSGIMSSGNGTKGGCAARRNTGRVPDRSSDQSLEVGLEALGATRLRDLNENGGSSRRGNERSLTVAGLVVSLRTPQYQPGRANRFRHLG